MLKRKQILLVVLLAVLSLTVGVGMRFYSLLNPEPDTIRENVAYDEATGAINFLIVGVDKVPGEEANRSDTIAFVSVDIDDRVIRLLSLPRDTRVQIPDHGWQKLNHAFAYGGIELLQKTVINYLGVPVQYYVIVNYENFPELVDLIGGVDMYVPKALRYNDRAGNLHIDIPSGTQHMDGKTALGYVRFRHDALGDIGRVERQQAFLKAVFTKIKEPSMWSRTPQLIRKALQMIKTNLSTTQALQLAAYFKDIPPDSTIFATLPGRAAYISGISYWVGDLSATSRILTAVPDTGNSSDNGVNEQNLQNVAELARQITHPVRILNGCGKGGLGTEVSTLLQTIGIDVANVGNAGHFDYRSSIVEYPADQGKTNEPEALALARLCGLPESRVRQITDGKNVTIIIGHDYFNVLRTLGGDNSR